MEWVMSSSANRSLEEKPQKKHSVFIKLTLLLALAAFLIHLVLAFSWGRMFSEDRSFMWKNLESYLQLAAIDLQKNPSAEHLLNFKKQTDLDVAYFPHTGESVKTNQNLSLENALTYSERDNARKYFRRGVISYKVKLSSGYMVFGLDLRRIRQPDSAAWWVPALLILLILFLVAVIARYWLLPIKYLSDAVRKVQAGNLNIRLPENRRDEFGALAKEWNRMLQKIQDLIAGRERLLQDMSHEIRSPLTRLRLMIEMLPEDNDRHDLEQELATIVSITEDILEEGRAGNAQTQLNVSRFELQQFLFSIVQKFSVVKIDLQNHSPAVLLNADKTRLLRLFSNLLDNAVRYANQENPVINVTVIAKESQVQISIEDNGLGVSQQHREHIFEPFFRADSARTPGSGFGLGLSIARRIARQHGGDLFLEKNNRFVVVLPFS
ncbi:MAG: HAMP domain-containing histidine kinase [Leptospiraceae bacterium]|nr:HAMP domain-containing histidine kinase [Leptospiraceae bacterium]